MQYDIAHMLDLVGDLQRVSTRPHINDAKEQQSAKAVSDNSVELAIEVPAEIKLAIRRAADEVIE